MSYIEDRLAAISYDPVTGLFDPPPRPDGQGYLRFRFGKGGSKGQVSAHRAAWFKVHGVWPTGEVDHINRVRDDNRIINLREVDDSLNQHNSGAQYNSKTGVRGVSPRKCGGYIAQIKINYKYQHRIGDDVEDLRDWLNAIRRANGLPEDKRVD